MTEHNNRQQLFEELVNARRELMRSMQFLDDRQATLYDDADEWCVRDVISSITGHECRALAAAQHLVEEGDPHFPDALSDHEFNRLAVRRRREFPLRDVVDELDGTRRELLRFTRKMHNNELYAQFTVRATGQPKSIADVLAELVEHDYMNSAAIWQKRAEMGMFQRSQFRHVLTDERNRLMTALGYVFQQDLFHVEICGYWTAKDVMAHLLSWDEEILRTVEHWAKDRPWQHDALYDDEWNEEEVSKRAHLDVVTLADSLSMAHRRLLEMFDRLPDAELASMSRAPWGERMALVSFLNEMALHNNTHRLDIETLRRSNPRPVRRR